MGSAMDEIEEGISLRDAIARIWSMALVQRLAGLAGFALIGAGYYLISSTSSLPDAADVEAVTRLAGSGMALVVCGGVVVVLVMLGWSRR